jgi:hypothetical protein
MCGCVADFEASQQCIVVYPTNAVVGAQKLGRIQNIQARPRNAIPKRGHSSTMQYPLPYHVGEQNWGQEQHENQESDGRPWNNATVPDEAERLPQSNVGQMSPGICSSPWHGGYQTPMGTSMGNGAYSHASKPTSLNAENRSVVTESFIQMNASPSTVPRWSPNQSVVPGAQYYPQVVRPSEGVGNFYQYVPKDLTPKDSSTDASAGSRSFFITLDTWLLHPFEKPHRGRKSTSPLHQALRQGKAVLSLVVIY